MTETTHTPGPWEHDTGFIVAPDLTGRFPDIYIAEIAYEDNEDRIAPFEEHGANGALLAAAPELLAALEAFLSIDSWDDEAVAPRALVEAARAAVAKAKAT
jgi:hypothetical protein